jgi:nicotinamide-nucleotide amidase
MVRAEIITIGDEILYGQILDTNTQWISFELDKLGIKTIRKSSVGDSAEEITAILNESKSRADVVFITGGLGPTKDDLTKKVLSDFFQCSQEMNEDALKDVTEFFFKRGRELTDINRGQALLPTKAQFIPNKQGTAPCMWFDEFGVIWVSMPGVPFEMKAIMENEVIPKLISHFKTPIIYHKVIKTIGIGESYLSDLIQDWELSLPKQIKLAYLPSLGIVKLRLTAFGDDLETLKLNVETQIDALRPTINSYIFGYNKDEISEVVGQLLLKNKATIALAESCTGGHLSHQFTQISGCSEYYMGGVISYSNEVKKEILHVSESILNVDGAVSESCVTAMAKSIREKFKSTYGMATSGIAGPAGGSVEKPVGTVWIALASEEEVITRKLHLGGNRMQNIHMTSLNSLNLLRRYLLKDL